MRVDAVILPLLMLAAQPSMPLLCATRTAAYRTRQPAMKAAARLEDLTVYELKAVCRAKGLKVSGRKAELIARVAAAPPGVVGAETAGARKASGRGRGARGSGRGSPRRQLQVPHVTDVAASTASESPPSVAVAHGAAQTPSSPTKAAAETVTAPIAAHLAAAGSVDAEVVGRREAEHMEDEQRRTKRRAARRAKLSQYFSEEFNSVLGALEQKAGPQFAAAFGSVCNEHSEAAASDELPGAVRGADTSEYIEAAQRRGNRLAWCRTFDAATGTGELVDLEERTAWPIDQSALCVNEEALEARLRVLHPGEFVEYEPEAATAHASGGKSAGRWVHGILGWPLMCETLNTHREDVGAVAGVR